MIRSNRPFRVTYLSKNCPSGKTYSCALPWNCELSFQEGQFWGVIRRPIFMEQPPGFQRIIRAFRGIIRHIHPISCLTKPEPEFPACTSSMVGYGQHDPASASNIRLDYFRRVLRQGFYCSNIAEDNKLYEWRTSSRTDYVHGEPTALQWAPCSSILVNIDHSVTNSLSFRSASSLM